MILLILLFILLCKTIYNFISNILNDISGPSYRSLYGLCEALKIPYDFLEQNLEKVGFKTSWSNPGIYYGRGTTLAPVDNILFFNSHNKEIYLLVIDNILVHIQLALKLDRNGTQIYFNKDL